MEKDLSDVGSMRPIDDAEDSQDCVLVLSESGSVIEELVGLQSETVKVEEESIDIYLTDEVKKGPQSKEFEAECKKEQPDQGQREKQRKTGPPRTKRLRKGSKGKKLLRRRRRAHSDRKVRQTVTQGKLDQLYLIFQEYDSLNNKQRIQRGMTIQSIARRLNLGNSTVMHKMKKFRKGCLQQGVLLQCKDSKRSYRKSSILDSRIMETMMSGELFKTAGQVGNYIEKNWGDKTSRSIVSRHLKSLGFQRTKSGCIVLGESHPQCMGKKREAFAKMLTGFDGGPYCFIYVSDATFWGGREEIRVMAAVTCEEVVHYQVYPESSAPVHFFDVLEKVGKRIPEMRTRYRLHDFAIITPITSTYSEEPEKEERMIEQALRRYGLKHYFLPWRSDDLSVASVMLEQVRENAVPMRTDLGPFFQLERELHVTLREMEGKAVEECFMRTQERIRLLLGLGQHDVA